VIVDIAADLRGRGAQLSGSFLTVPATKRFDAARRLVESGAFIHADVLDGTFDIKSGADPGLLLRLSAEWPAMLDIHLIKEDPADAIRDLVVSNQIARITVHVRPHHLADHRAVLAGKSAAFWVSIELDEWSADELASLLDRDRPDGVLVMLTPPGTRKAKADYRNLDTPQWAAVHANGPMGVDGGVTRDRLDQLVEAGANYVVMGRYLFPNHTGHHKQVSNHGAQRAGNAGNAGKKESA
jgi:pentose-5-phosphate-3-epimerase